MKKRFVAQKLLERLNSKVQRQLDLRETLILGVVLKGLPVAYGLAKANGVVENFVPLVAQRHIYLQHHVESYFPSSHWITYLSRQLSVCKHLLIVDDVVNTGFTRQKVESIIQSLNLDRKKILSRRFAALILNQKSLANPKFVEPDDFYAMKVVAIDIECDWGLLTVPLWDLSVSAALQRCEEYYRRFWQNENRWVTITY